MTDHAADQRRVAKAARLLIEGRVHRIHDRVFVVVGDSANYLVTVADAAAIAAALSAEPPHGMLPRDGYCPCPSTNDCCPHLLAARLLQAKIDHVDEMAARS
jgi:hypothetical protein